MDLSQYLVRFWVADALSGDIVGEVHLTGSSTWGSRFGGGTFRASLDVGRLKARDGVTLDWAAISQVIGWVTGGRYSLVLTLGTTCLGEWLVMRREEGTTPDGAVPISGMEWDGYPAIRGVSRDLRYASAPRVQMGAILLSDAFKHGQPAMQITVPASTGLGSRVAVDQRVGESYYADLLEEISDTSDGFDWRVVPTLTWVNGEPTKVVRTVEFGMPVLGRSTAIVVDYDGPGFRSGNCLSYTRGFDFTRAASTVYGSGAGQGDDQPKWEATWDELTSQGFVQTSQIVNYPGVKNSEELGFLVRGERDAAKNVHDPATATLLLEKTAGYPRVGDVVGVEIEPTYSLPSGRYGSMRLGETSLTLDGPLATTIDIDGI